MQRNYHSFPIKDNTELKNKMLDWSNRFNICCFLDNNSYLSSHNTVECLVGVGVLKAFEPSVNFFDSLSVFVESANDYIFGHFNYELKDITEPCLSSYHKDFIGFPEYFLFIPEVVLLLEENILHIGVFSQDANIIYQDIVDIEKTYKTNPYVDINARITKAQYIEAVDNLQRHIHLGDCYVINYCQEFYAYANVDPVLLYTQLVQRSPNPFAAYYKLVDHYLLCASPERFIKKEGSTIISQPIKGTAPRNYTDKVSDDLSKEQLYNSLKERSENVMVVDLVRNDLGRICKTGSVEVDELFGIYTFPNVHQMISTVCGQLTDDIGFGDILKSMFPMGSMTGAPKHRVMELTEQYEYSLRGIYSGTVGYIAPNKDFDFNVVIRSIVYNATALYLSYQVGSAITAYSNPEDEYIECLLKGRAIASLLTGEGQ